MRIWYQSYGKLGFDPKWQQYRDDLEGYIRKVARQDTTVDIHGVSNFAAKMNYSPYIQFMHVSQVIDNALQAEREGYDAFCIGGTLDLGHIYLRELLDIPLAFIAESSFLHACLFARKFGIVSINEGVLRGQMELVKYHGLEGRCVPGVHMGSFVVQHMGLFAKDPKQAVEIFTEAGRKVIAQGAGVIVPGYGAWSTFLGQQNVHCIDGVPIVDNIAAVIKTAETLVDLKKLGLKRGRPVSPTYPTKEDLLAARKLYGVEK